MALSKEQIDNLLGMISSAKSDTLDCDGCFDHLAEFAQIHLESREIPDALAAVETHVEQCKCCNDEFNVLLEGLRAIGGTEENA